MQSWYDLQMSRLTTPCMCKTNGMGSFQHSTVLCVMGLPCAQGLPHSTLSFTYPLLFLAPQDSLEEEILILNPWLCAIAILSLSRKLLTALLHPLKSCSISIWPSCNPATALWLPWLLKQSDLSVLVISSSEVLLIYQFTSKCLTVTFHL